jgi:hypothetical protein
MNSALFHAQRGSLMLESFVASVPVWLGFVLLCQVTDLYAHRLIVQRAAAAAARAAVVVLPDAGVHYGDPLDRSRDRFSGERKRAVTAAVTMLLSASSSFDPSTTQLELEGSFTPGSQATVRLSTQYSCVLSSVRLLCGLDGKMQLSAEARLAYQGATYSYARGG